MLSINHGIFPPKVHRTVNQKSGLQDFVLTLVTKVGININKDGRLRVNF